MVNAGGGAAKPPRSAAPASRRLKPYPSWKSVLVLLVVFRLDTPLPKSIDVHLISDRLPFS